MKLMMTMMGFLLAALPAHAATPYEKVVTQLRALETQYPAVAKVYSIGKNDDGVDILAMRVSTTPAAVDPQKIGHLVISTHHGDETYAAAFTMYFLRDLVARYAADPSAEAISSREYTVVPVLNVSGFNAATREEHHIDPNRDYPSPCLTQAGGSLKSIKQAMALFGVRTFAGTVTVHGYDGSLSYPWGVEADSYEAKDHDNFAEIFAKAAAKNRYRSGTSGDMIYPANGTFEDWAYWKHGAWSMLIELRDGSAGDIADTAKAVQTYFDELDASPLTSAPSDANQFLATCLDEHRVHGHERRE